MKTRLGTLSLFMAAAALGVGACGGNAAPRENAASTSTTVAALPATPTGQPILHIAVNGGAPLAVDFATLDAMATQTYKVMEPFEKKEIAFKGVEFSSVLRAAGVPASAKNVHIAALDDYQIDLSMAEIRKGGIVLATQADGSTIPLDHGGPSRIIFLDGVASGANPDQWIWSLSHITVS